MSTIKLFWNTMNDAYFKITYSIAMIVSTMILTPIIVVTSTIGVIIYSPIIIINSIISFINFTLLFCLLIISIIVVVFIKIPFGSSVAAPFIKIIKYYFNNIDNYKIKNII